MNNPASVLNGIASTLHCRLSEIENTLEARAKAAGLNRSPLPRHNSAEPRLDAIRRWLNTPEATSVISAAHEFYRDSAASPPPSPYAARHKPDKA